MRLPFQSKPKTFADRAQAAAGDVAEFARSIPKRLDDSRERAFAVAGAAGGLAAALAFWRSRSDNDPSVHHDPAKPATPWKTQPPGQRPPETGSKPVTSTNDAAASAAGARSK
jgi:hypothetical protein